MKTALFSLFLSLSMSASGFAQSLHFDGTNDYVQTPVVMNLSFLTFECWVKGDSAPSTLVGMDGPMYGHNFGILWNHFPDFYKSAFVQSIDGNYYTATFGDLNPNTWYHLAAVYDGIQLRSYVNGVLVSSVNTAGATDLTNVAFLKLGCHPSNGLDFFEGSIDEVRVWEYARSCEELNEYKNVELVGNESGLLAYYKFNEGTPASDNTSIVYLHDEVANADNANLQGFALSGSVSNFVAGTPLNAPAHDCLTSTTPVAQSVSLRFFPNPTPRILNIQSLKDTRIAISNILGEVVLVEDMASGTLSLDLAALAPGVYFLNADGRSQRFVKQ